MNRASGISNGTNKRIRKEGTHREDKRKRKEEKGATTTKKREGEKRKGKNDEIDAKFNTLKQDKSPGYTKDGSQHICGK